MSNTRKLRRPAGENRPRCGTCGGKVAADRDRITLPDGRLICLRCRDAGVLCRRLPCGHMAMPGTLVITDSADASNFQCRTCSPHSSLPG